MVSEVRGWIFYRTFFIENRNSDGRTFGLWRRAVVYLPALFLCEGLIAEIDPV